MFLLLLLLLLLLLQLQLLLVVFVLLLRRATLQCGEPVGLCALKLLYLLSIARKSMGGHVIVSVAHCLIERSA